MSIHYSQTWLALALFVGFVGQYFMPRAVLSIYPKYHPRGGITRWEHGAPGFIPRNNADIWNHYGVQNEVHPKKTYRQWLCVITVTSYWALWRLKSPAIRLFTQPFQAQIKENFKAPCHWPLCGEFTGEFPAQRTSSAENVPIWLRHHGNGIDGVFTPYTMHVGNVVYLPISAENDCGYWLICLYFLQQ